MRRHTEPIQHFSPGDIRCVCRQLLAKWCASGLEVKCKGCKKTALIPFSCIEGWDTHTSHS